MKNLIPFCFCVLFVSNAYALNLTGYRFTDSYRFAVIDDTLSEKYNSQYVINSSYAFVNSPFYETNILTNKISRTLIDYHQIMTIGGTYYLSEKAALSVNSAYLSNQAYGKDYQGFTDTEVRARFRFYKEGAHALAFSPYITVPTGKSENFTTTESTGLGLSLIGDMKIEKVLLLASLGYYTAKDNKISAVDYSELVTTTLGISWDFTENWMFNFEAIRNFTAASDQGQDDGDYYLTTKYSGFQTTALYLGGGIAGVNSPYNENYTLMAGIKLFGGP